MFRYGRKWMAGCLALSLLLSNAVVVSAGVDDAEMDLAAGDGKAGAGITAENAAAFSELLLLKPVATTAGSETAAGRAANATDNSGMSGFFGPLESHGNDANGAAMWLTEPNPGANDWIQLDFGAVYPLGRMLVWNYNQPGEMDKGIKKAQIQYSADGQTWTTLGGSGAVRQFAKAKGTADQKASQVNAPIDFGGAPARYVRIVPIGGKNQGNWGGGGSAGPQYGLSEIRVYKFYSPVTASGQLIAGAHASAGSENASAPAVNAINNFGMSGAIEKSDTLNRTGGWLTQADPGSENWIQFDLGGTYPVGEMHVWNYNGQDDYARGVRWAKVKYSSDGINWTYLNGGSPVQFARANGDAESPATNVAGSGDPVYFGGASARYVRIEPSLAADKPGNWGGTTGSERVYGLGQVRFYSASGILTESAPEWTSLFNRTSGWTGSDGIFSIAYNGYDAPGKAVKTNTMFLFSDTFTGSVDPVTKARDLQGFYNNTLATLKGGDPDPARMRFLWGSDGSGQDFKSIFEPTTPYAYVGTVAANTVNQAFGMSPVQAPTAPGSVAPPQPSDTHDNDKDGATMWLSADNPGSGNWIKFDLTASYPLGKMPVWNYNQFDPAHPDIPYVNRGLKNVKIFYSNDDVNYSELPGTYRLAKASGSSSLSATNLTGGGEVDFGGVTARYVKIVPNAAAGDGNWGGTTGTEAMFGLSQVRFYSQSGELLRFVTAAAGSTYQTTPAGNWYWLQDGVSLNGKFSVFALNMAPDPTQPPGWQFKVVGVAMAQVPNRNGPDLSGITQTDTPLYYKTSIGGWSFSYTYGAGVMPNTAEAGAPAPDGYVYVYGYRDYAFERLLTVARVKAEDFDKFNEWRFWGGSDKGWSRNIEDSAPLLSGTSVSAELSVTPMKSGPFAGKYLLVYEKDTLSHYMTYSVGDSPVGPFRAPVSFYYAPEPAMGQGMNTYNAKAHPHLSQDGELLITYNVNTTINQSHYDNGTIYHPRWLRMRWIQGPAVTDIQVVGGQESVVTQISNTAKTIRVANGTTVGQLLAGIRSTDGSLQTYEVYEGGTGGARITDSNALLASGQVLKVVTSDPNRTASYKIEVSELVFSNRTDVVVKTGFEGRVATDGASVVEAVYGTTTDDLKASLQSGDGSVQIYRVLAGPGGQEVTGASLLAEGQVLRVTAADGVTAADYDIHIVERYIAGVTATAGSEENFFGVWSASHTVDNSGMSGTAGSKTDLHGTSYTDVWLTTADADGSNNWIRFDLGGVFRLGEMQVWNYNEAGQPAKGIKNATVEYSEDGVTWTALGAYQFAQASGTDGLAATNLAGGGVVNFSGASARYVRITPNPGSNDGNYGGFGAGLNPYFGLSEVRFYTAAPTP